MPIYLWLVLCLGPNCESQQVYQVDSFTHATKNMDCEKRKKEWDAKLTPTKRGSFRTSCKTMAEMQREGL